MNPFNLYFSPTKKDTQLCNYFISPLPLKQTASCKYGLIPWSVLPPLPLQTKTGSDNLLSQPVHLILVDETRDFGFEPQGTILTLEKYTLLVFSKIHMAPQTSVSILPPATLHDLQCFLQPFHLCFGSWFQISSDLLAFSKMEFAFLSSILPCCFGVVSETRKGECQVYSSTYNLEVLSRSNFLLQPGVMSPYDFQSPTTCLLSKYAVHMLVTSNLSLKRLSGLLKVSELVRTQVSWFLVHTLNTLHMASELHWPSF